MANEENTIDGLLAELAAARASARMLQRIYEAYVKVDLETGRFDVVFSTLKSWHPHFDITTGTYLSLFANLRALMEPAYASQLEQKFTLDNLRGLKDGAPVHELMPFLIGGDWRWLDVLIVRESVEGECANLFARDATKEVQESRRNQREREAADSRDAILKNVMSSLFGYIMTIDLESLTYRLTPGSGMESSVQFLSMQNDYHVAYAAKQSHLTVKDKAQLDAVMAPESLRAASERGVRGFFKAFEHHVSVLGHDYWEEMSVYLGVDEEGRRVATLLVRDVTAAHERLDAERAAEQRVSQAKSLFLSTVSHDLRTPLNAIIGYSEMLNEGIADAEERQQAVRTVYTSGKVLLELINDVLDFSKLDSGKMEIVPEPTDIPALARETAAAFDLQLARKDVKLVLDIPEMPLLKLDPRRIRQVLFNLLGNAAKFTDRGSITVRIRWVDQVFSLSVLDTGCGIPEDDKERLMQPFVQGRSRNGSGTGLGLAICRQLAERMGGKLHLASTLGVGSAFTLKIPIVKSVAASEAPSAAASKPTVACPSAVRTRPNRILIVDDSPVNLMVLGSMLSRLGYNDVVKAENGCVALERLEEGGIDFVLTDLWMPEMDGSQFIRVLRRKESESGRPPLPVYALTADVEALKDWASLGFNGIMVKPITKDALMKALACPPGRSPCP